MRYFLTLLMASAAFGGVSRVEILAEGKLLQERSGEIFEVYALMTRRMGIPNQAGHTMAAAVLTKCLGQTQIIDQLLRFDTMLAALRLAKSGTIARGAENLAPQITFVAATLACKNTNRTPGQLVQNLEITYRALVQDGWVDWLPNVVAASELLR